MLKNLKIVNLSRKVKTNLFFLKWLWHGFMLWTCMGCLENDRDLDSSRCQADLDLEKEQKCPWKWTWQKWLIRQFWSSNLLGIVRLISMASKMLQIFLDVWYVCWKINWNKPIKHTKNDSTGGLYSTNVQKIVVCGKVVVCNSKNNLWIAILLSDAPNWLWDNDLDKSCFKKEVFGPDARSKRSFEECNNYYKSMDDSSNGRAVALYPAELDSNPHFGSIWDHFVSAVGVGQHDSILIVENLIEINKC